MMGGMKIRTVLALTDLDEASLTGLRFGYRIAAEKGAKLVVGHVLIPRTLDPSDVREFLRDHGLDPDAAVIDIEVDADVFSGIDLLVEQQAPDLVVVSSVRKRGLKRLLTTSVPVGLVGDTTCPVLALHADHDVESFRHALVCTDGSGSGQGLLEDASRLLGDGGKITAIMAVEDSPLVVAGVDIGTYDEAVLAKAKDAANKYLEALKPVEGYGLDTDVRVGNAVEAIKQAGAEHGCDLVVIGAGGIGGRASFVMGRVAAGVVRECDVPVLVVPDN